MTSNPQTNAVMPFGKHAGRLISTVTKEQPGYLLWFCTLPKARADARLCAALATYLPGALLGAAAEDRARIERREAEAQARRQRMAEIKAAHWARITAEIC